MGSQSVPRYFPRPDEADAEGLVAVGGILEPEVLVDAYEHGIFPWPVGVEETDELVLAWWSPDPRAVIEFGDFHIPRRLRSTLRGTRWEVSADERFEEVIQGCSQAGDRVGNTWITPSMVEAYCRLHRMGVAHSVEVSERGRLIGGIYGVAIGGMFAAESMFFYESGASKLALVALIQHLRSGGFSLIDIQQMTTHLLSFGAKDIPRDLFLDRLAIARAETALFGRDVHWRL